MKDKALFAIHHDDNQAGVYGIGADQGMYYKLLDRHRPPGSEWLPNKTGWLGMGGAFDSIPSAAVKGLQFRNVVSVDVFGLGLDDQMYQASLAGGEFPLVWPPKVSGWSGIGGVFDGSFDVRGVESGVAAASELIAGLGTDNQPYLKAFTSSDGTLFNSTDWVPVGGILIYEPAIANGVKPSTYEVFGIGTDRQMYMLQVDVSSGSVVAGQWIGIGGCFNSPPVLAQWSSGRVDIFCLGSDNSMYHRARENGAWVNPSWEFLNGVFDSAPAVVSWNPDRLDIFGLGTDDQMYHSAWAGSQWLPWEPIGGSFNSAPVAVSLAPSTLDVFALGKSNDVQHKAWDGSQWLPSQNGWESLGGVFIIPRATRLPSQLDFNWPISFSDGTPLGGSVHVTLFADGRSRYSGYIHDSGFPSYALSVASAVIDRMNRAYTFFNTGHVWGTDLPGSRDFTWMVDSPPNSSLRDNWSDIFACGGPKFGVELQPDPFPPGGLSMW